jgi:hypothetical protein
MTGCREHHRQAQCCFAGALRRVPRGLENPAKLKLPKTKKLLKIETANERYRQQAAIRPKHLRFKAACIYAGVSRQTMWQWDKAGYIETVLVKSRPDSKSGMRMVSVESIDRHLSSFAA